VIDRGPAHWAGTSFPGGPGNVVLAGHRSTHTRPFTDLDRLAPGDLVYLTNPRGFEVMYKVTETFIVAPTALWISYDNGEPLLTMFACHPKGSAAQRIVVRAQLVGGGIIA
jgi:sortase A